MANLKFHFMHPNATRPICGKSLARCRDVLVERDAVKFSEYPPTWRCVRCSKVLEERQAKAARALKETPDAR